MEQRIPLVQSSVRDEVLGSGQELDDMLQEDLRGSTAAQCVNVNPAEPPRYARVRKVRMVEIPMLHRGMRRVTE